VLILSIAAVIFFPPIFIFDIIFLPTLPPPVVKVPYAVGEAGALSDSFDNRAISGGAKIINF